DFAPAVLADNSAPDRSTVHRRIRELFTNRQLKVLKLSAGDQFEIGRDVLGKVLFPSRGFAAATADDQALVVQLSVETTKILFVSDSGYATEKALLGSKLDLRSDILVKGQHQSGNSGSDTFLDVVRPRLIIATSRDFPQQQRIRDEWAERVRARGIKLFRQDE